MQQTPGLLTHGLLSAVVWYLCLLQQLGMCVGVNLHVQFIPSLEVIRRRPGRFVRTLMSGLITSGRTNSDVGR